MHEQVLIPAKSWGWLEQTVFPTSRDRQGTQHVLQGSGALSDHSPSALQRAVAGHEAPITAFDPATTPAPSSPNNHHWNALQFGEDDSPAGVTKWVAVTTLSASFHVSERGMRVCTEHASIVHVIVYKRSVHTSSREQTETRVCNVLYTVQACDIITGGSPSCRAIPCRVLSCLSVAFRSMPCSSAVPCPSYGAMARAH